MKRTFRVPVFVSGDDTHMKITGIENFLCQESLSAKKFSEMVSAVIRDYDTKIVDSEFDVLSISNRWLDPNEDIQYLPEEESTLVLVSKVIKNELGSDGSFYTAMVELNAKLRENKKQAALVDIAKSLEQLMSILNGMDASLIDKISKIVTVNPNFMGIGVNLNNLFALLKKVLKK